MPLFSKKFTSPKLTSRKKLPNHPESVQLKDYNYNFPIKLKLGSTEVSCEDGKWKSGADSGLNNAYEALLDRSEQLIQQNNYLHIKVQILLDMLTEETAEGKKKEREIKSLKKELFKLCPKKIKWQPEK